MSRIQKDLMNLIAIMALIMIFASGTAIAKDCGNGIAPCECGDTVVTNWTFTGDLTCPAGVAGVHGLTIGADGITIDGAGFKIMGSETAEVCDWVGETNPNAGYCGVFNKEYGNVVIKNLEVVGFCTGIGLQGSGKNPVTNNTIDNCEIHGNGDADCSTDTSTHGIHACYIKASTIKNNRIYKNTGTGAGCGDGGNGIFLYAGSKNFTDNLITKNEIYDNRKGGFFTKKGLHYAKITENHIYGNGQGGILLRCSSSSYNLIEGNNASANFGDGIFIGAQYNTIRNNVITDNIAGFKIKPRDAIGDGDGIDMGRGKESNNNDLTLNEVCGNEGTDIDVTQDCVGNHGSDNTCDTTENYHDDGVAGCNRDCGGEVTAATGTETKTETKTETNAEAEAEAETTGATEASESTETFATVPGFTAAFSIAGLLLIVLVPGLESRRKRLGKRKR
ncbi:MAG: right-handed parallel beta-helix repeat-containing protein [Euryarchaeota archaeon]|nr:right-handed parallel beta-helix repeat-containing protein [Euryarchaeota archaeon]